AVTAVATADEALALAAREQYDLVLIDVDGPGSGFELLTQIRDAHPSHELPVIMVTARNDGTDVIDAFRLGANDYVSKPIDSPVALARIATHLSHRRAIADLRESEERYALALQGANDGLWDWNLISNEVRWSERWKAMLGCEDADVSANPDEWFTRVHRDDVAAVKESLQTHLACGRGNWESEHRILHRNGTFRWVLCRAATIRNQNSVATRLAGSMTDITDTKVSDALTGLPNRLLFVDLLDRAIKRIDRRRNYTFALLALSLDRFRVVGDSLGPMTADRLLVAVAQRLQSSLRPTDVVSPEDPGVTLARIASDEFTVLVDDISGDRDALRGAERLRRALEKPFVIDGHELFTSATVGIAVSTTGYRRPEEILRDASTALHRAQAKGAPVELFDVRMRDRAVERLRLETDLRNGIRDHTFVVHYQPIVSLDSGRIAGFEALVRWRHPRRGLIGPLEFIHVAEDTGMIVPIGRLILHEACSQMAEWERRFNGGTSAVMCVNVSSRQFLESDFASDVERILTETGLAGSNLKLEITESAFIGNVRDAQVTLGRLSALGVAWSIDDFGTGYSSLSHLHQLQVDTVKIDRSFVNRMSIDKDGWEMVRAIVTLAHNLNMDVVAEGVENLAQIASLRALGCEYAQGFYLSKPVDAPAADRLHTSQPWRFAPVFRPGIATAGALHRSI
ncbi:MAG TPA: EAL domain-containing protein, partial [Vicinamibacterales bacterium]|nr:EAL domain-containing protein [Vicinamibacterales bacterium]